MENVQLENSMVCSIALHKYPYYVLLSFSVADEIKEVVARRQARVQMFQMCKRVCHTHTQYANHCGECNSTGLNLKWSIYFGLELKRGGIETIAST